MYGVGFKHSLITMSLPSPLRLSERSIQTESTSEQSPNQSTSVLLRPLELGHLQTFSSRGHRLQIHALLDLRCYRSQSYMYYPGQVRSAGL